MLEERMLEMGQGHIECTSWKPAQHKSEEELSIGKINNVESTTHLAPVDDSENEIEPCGGAVGKFVKKSRDRISQMCYTDPNCTSRLKDSVIITALCAYGIYVFTRWIYSDCKDVDWGNGYGLLFILYGFLAIYLLIRILGTQLGTICALLNTDKFKTGIRWFYYFKFAVVVITFLVISIKDAVNEPRRYISLAGYLCILLTGFLFSKHPDYVRWDTICRGVSLHLVMSLLIIKWPPGREFLTVVSEKVIGFMDFALVGARFVYGDLLIDLGVFIFKGLSVLFFLAMVINVLFYYGILQKMFFNLGRLMQVLLGTTIIESSNAVATVFLGMSESPLLFKPYLQMLTSSEIHAIMTGGFATVAGTVLAAYVSFGANPATLVSASAMAAPASLTLAKLYYPESEKTKTSTKNFVLHKSEDLNVMDAACKGALLGCELVPAIAANVLACVSLVACFNSVLSWLGQLAGIPGLTFENLVGWIFVPLAWIMGVTPSEVDDVAKLIGIKTVVNEFVGYKELGVLKNAGKLTVRSQVIATYAMCGFANPGSVAILVSGLITVCPLKRQVFSEVAFRAFVAGSCTSFLSATLAGFLTPENGFNENLSDSISTNSSLHNTSCYFYNW